MHPSPLPGHKQGFHSWGVYIRRHKLVAIHASDMYNQEQDMRADGSGLVFRLRSGVRGIWDEGWRELRCAVVVVAEGACDGGGGVVG